MKKKEPYLLAVTGNVGVGKSLVGNLLKKEDVLVIDTDKLVEDILRRKNKITQFVVKCFGKRVINRRSDYYIDKKVLGEIVFNNKSSRKKLESLIHPEVKKRLSRLIKRNLKRSIIAVLIPLLFEAKQNGLYDEVWCVKCKKNIQLKRLKLRGVSRGDAMKRIEAQFSQGKKVRMADFVIDNSNTITRTKTQVISRLNIIKGLIGTSPYSYIVCGSINP